MGKNTCEFSSVYCAQRDRKPGRIIMSTSQWNVMSESNGTCFAACRMATPREKARWTFLIGGSMRTALLRGEVSLNICRFKAWANRASRGVCAEIRRIAKSPSCRSSRKFCRKIRSCVGRAEYGRRM